MYWINPFFSLCHSFNGKLKLLLEDAAYYLRSNETQQPIEEKDSTSHDPFDKYADDSKIQNMLQTNSINCINR
jgi:hypothetical protein